METAQSDGAHPAGGVSSLSRIELKVIHRPRNKFAKEPIMCTKIFKWFGIVLGSLLVLTAVVLGVLYARGNARLTKQYDVEPESVPIPTDQASLEQGKKWATVLCADCHGQDFSGKPLVDDKTVGFVPAPNLTSGEGGAGGEFTDADWILALRHGIDPHEGRALIAMPSMNYSYLADKDLGEIIAYMKTVPSMNNELGEPELSFIGKVLLAAGGFGKNILPAEVIAHPGPVSSAVGPSVNVEYGGASVQHGDYLVRVIGCRDCHGQNLTGGSSPAPGAPYAPDLTSSGVGGTWSTETFITAVRTMKGKGMPWAALKPLGDPELEAILLYLQSLPSH
jgi:mono/diheme cytochrome c family protein